MVPGLHPGLPAVRDIPSGGAAGPLERIFFAGCAAAYRGFFALRMLVYHPAVYRRVRRLQRLVRIAR